jgi:hypothetical protein
MRSVMQTRATVAFMLIGLIGIRALGAPVPCRFGGFDGDSTFEDIGASYKAADLVVIGTVTGKTRLDNNLVFNVQKVIKGAADTQITLHAHHVQNTEINGFFLPENTQFLLLLMQGPSGVFDSVESYNSGCATSYSVRDSNVVLVEPDEHNPGTKIPVTDVARFLISNPPRVVHKYR